MKSTFLNFFKKYWLCILLSTIIGIGFPLTIHYADLLKIGSGMIVFDLSALYLFCFAPIYSLMYGCLSYVILKKVWLPQLLLYVIGYVWLIIAHLAFYKEVDGWIIFLIYFACLVFFSLLGALASAFIKTIVKEIKASYDKNSKTEEQNIETE